MKHNGISFPETANAPFHETPINAQSVRAAYAAWEKRRGIEGYKSIYQRKAEKYKREQAEKMKGSK